MKKYSFSLLRITAVAIVCTGFALITTSCSQQQAAEIPPAPPRDSPESPVKRINPRLADKANAGISTAVKPMKRNHQ